MSTERTPTGLPTRPARRTKETAPFWDAAGQGRLVLPRCVACDEYIWYPRRFCPFCGSREVTWVEVSGRGVVYAHTTVRKGMGPYAAVGPYVLAYVELDEGPRILTNVVGIEPSAVACGMPVVAVFDPAGDADAVVRFRPA
jgi:uncharacterized OB-fold protein